MVKISLTKFFKPMIAVVIIAMLVTFVSPQISEAQASEFKVATSDEVSQKELAGILKFYFDKVGELTDEGYVIKDKELFDAKVFAGDPAAIKLKELIQADSEPTFQVASATTFGKCVVNKMVSSYGNIARQWLTGSIFTYIKTKQYDLAAKLIFKSLVKAGFKVNAASLAIELGYYGWQCRGKW
ncbi:MULTISPECIES: hypothetical protein [Bacillus]|uniref:hypothetical protein n=1 Tax=Bacillus TaxID=1386 RepID=UPI000744B85A|nr:hypothetical protein [Bacillus velezensis]WKW10767.1 hypothetical protein Q3Y59_19675 [Bacillus velezensis]CUX95618.1 conserved exported protein of unknown function [Bacillus velezensis]